MKVRERKCIRQGCSRDWQAILGCRGAVDFSKLYLSLGFHMYVVSPVSFWNSRAVILTQMMTALIFLSLLLHARYPSNDGAIVIVSAFYQRSFYQGQGKLDQVCFISAQLGPKLKICHWILSATCYCHLAFAKLWVTNRQLLFNFISRVSSISWREFSLLRNNSSNQNNITLQSQSLFLFPPSWLLRMFVYFFLNYRFSQEPPVCYVNILGAGALHFRAFCVCILRPSPLPGLPRHCCRLRVPHT